MVSLSLSLFFNLFLVAYFIYFLQTLQQDFSLHIGSGKLFNEGNRGFTSLKIHKKPAFY